MGLEADINLQEAVSLFCEAGLGLLVSFYVDPAWLGNYRRLVGQDTWIEEAFITYMGMKQEHDRIAAEEDMLVQSMRHFSRKPLVVANFNKRIPKHWDPAQYPRMVLMHARSTTSFHKSFNFNKITAMLFTKVKSGMVLDADQFANEGVDLMLKRASEETNRQYPYPIMPVHWMSRDPDSSDMAVYPARYTWRFKSKEAPVRSMRWGVLAPQSHAPKWLQEQGHLEDEELLNVALWAEAGTKQWCRYDLTSPNMFDKYLKQDSRVNMMQDEKYYPKGIAYVYITAHDAKKPEESHEWLSKLWSEEYHSEILYDGHWFTSAEELKSYDPTLKCIV